MSEGYVSRVHKHLVMNNLLKFIVEVVKNTAKENAEVVLFNLLNNLNFIRASVNSSCSNLNFFKRNRMI